MAGAVTGGISLPDGTNIEIADGTGTSLGSTSAAVVGFHGANAAQAAFITSPAASAASCKTAIDAIRVLLSNKGLMASS